MGCKLLVVSNELSTEEQPMRFDADALATVALVAVGILAFLGAIDYIHDSIVIFLDALREYRKRKEK